MVLEGTVHTKPPSLLIPTASSGSSQNHPHVQKFARKITELLSESGYNYGYGLI